MKTIYIDSNFMCHTTNDGTMVEVQTDALDDFCNNAIEVVRLIPQGQEWTRPDGIVLHGEFIQITDTNRFNAYQRQFMEDQEQMADMQTALGILGVNP